MELGVLLWNWALSCDMETKSEGIPNNSQKTLKIISKSILLRRFAYYSCQSWNKMFTCWFRCYTHWTRWSHIKLVILTKTCPEHYINKHNNFKQLITINQTNYLFQEKSWNKIEWKFGYMFGVDVQICTFSRQHKTI